MYPRINNRSAWIGILVCLLLTACSGLASSDARVGKGLDPQDYFQGPALEIARAVDRRDKAALERMIHQQGIDPDKLFVTDKSQMPLVAWPVENQDLEGLKLLLEAGANPNARWVSSDPKHPYQRDNAMVLAAMGPPEYLKLLLEHGGDPDTLDSSREPLMYTARLANHWDNVKLLVEHGANVNIAMHGDRVDTPAAWYARLGDFEEVYWLLEHGADPTVKLHSPGFPQDGTMPIVEAIYYLPVKDRVIPWQRKCQHWLRDHGIERPPIPDFLKKRRVDFGLPSEEKDIPLL